MTATGWFRNAGGARLSGRGILRSEWIKLWSLRSSAWSYVIVFAVTVGIAWSLAATFPAPELEALDPGQRLDALTQVATSGILFAQLFVAVLGVLVITGEYSTGMIRSTLAAVPRRLGVLWAKAAVVFGATLAIGLASIGTAFVVAIALVGASGIDVGMPDDAALGALAGGALYLAIIAVFSLALGTMIRNSAGGISAAVGIVLLVPIALQLIPADWAAKAARYTPSSAGSALYYSIGDGVMRPWEGGLVLLAWVLGGMVSAAVLLKSRDA